MAMGKAQCRIGAGSISHSQPELLPAYTHDDPNLLLCQPLRCFRIPIRVLLCRREAENMGGCGMEGLMYKKVQPCNFLCHPYAADLIMLTVEVLAHSLEVRTCANCCSCCGFAVRTQLQTLSVAGAPAPTVFVP